MPLISKGWAEALLLRNIRRVVTATSPGVGIADALRRSILQDGSDLASCLKRGVLQLRCKYRQSVN